MSAMAIGPLTDESKIDVLPELMAAYRRRALRLGVAAETESQVREALRRRRCVQAEMRAGGEAKAASRAPVEDPLNQRGLARLIEESAGTWIDHVDVELATRDELP